MLVRVKKIVALGVMTLAAAVISLPGASYSATSPSVSVLSPLAQGLRAPVKLTLDADGNIFVADQRVGGIVRYNASGAQLGVIRTAGVPNGLAFAQGGTLLVSQGSFVASYDVATGNELNRLTGGALQNASGIAVDDVTGFIYVADSGANQVEVYNASGAYVSSFGKGVRADASGATVKNATGMLSMPTGIAFEKISRHIVVADTLSSRVQFFNVDNNNAFVKSIGNVIPGDNYTSYSGVIAPMQFVSPVAIVFEYNNDNSALNRMYVVDSYQGNVQVVDPSIPAAINVAGTTKNFIGTPGIANGQLMVPSDATFDAVNKRLLVVNGFGNITIFGIDGGSNPVVVEPPPPVDPPVVEPTPVLTLSVVPAITNTAVIAISGTVTAGSVVKVNGNAAVVVGDVWSYSATLAEGSNTLTVSAQKLNSNQSVATAEVILDTTSPVLVVSALANGSYTSTQVQNISGTVADLNGASVFVNGVAAGLTGNEFSAAVSLLNGSNQISVEAVDAVGNTTSNIRTIVFDASKPNILIASPVDNIFTANASVTISGSVDKVAAISVAGNPAAVDGNNWSATVALVAGVNTVEIKATDLTGNVSSVKRTITLDAAKPTLAIVSPAQDLAVNVPNVQISGTVSDTTSLAVEYSANGISVAVPVTNGIYSFNIDFVSEGIYPVTITAKDAAGNTSAVVRNVIYDKTPPLFTLNQVSGVAPEKLSGTVENGSSVVVKDGTTQIGLVASANGSWVADLSGVTYNSDSLLAIATDAAGNSTSRALVFNFPDGTLNGSGTPTVQDALRSIRIVVNQSTPSAAELAHYDIGPLVGGKPNPNGRIEIVDAILILRKALGLTSW